MSSHNYNRGIQMSSKSKDDYNEKDIQAYKNLFQCADVDGNGRISLEELNKMISALKEAEKIPKEYTLRRLFAENKHGDSGVNFDEFLELMPALPTSHNMLLQAFRAIDVNKTGKLSKLEIKNVIMYSSKRYINKAKVAEMIEKVDQDGDGLINYMEYLKISRDIDMY